MSMTNTGADTTAFVCFECREPLNAGPEDVLKCPACQKSWPIRGGVPRFYEPAYYWGEIPLEEAEQMIVDAERNGWRQTVERKFANEPDFLISLMDWQRASWLPLLALPAGAVALDVGCGNGAITHSLARSVKHLYSLEAVPQRIGFTQVRLRQEGIENVRLVQASALEPPFQDGMFDLIVVNGVLEWVGQWVETGDPRQIQVRFLQNLARMMKPNGIMMIGIENRAGFDAFRGAMDHSGLPYTSLMPRRVATMYLRHGASGEYRMERSERQEYRTYTYTERGYIKLLADSGLPSVSVNWADPGYNQPYHLIPVENSLPSVHLAWKHHEPQATASRGWKAYVKKLAARITPLARAACSEFVMFASKGPGDQLPPLWRCLRDEMPDLPAVETPLLALKSHAFSSKNVIQVFERGSLAPSCIIRTTTPGTEGAEEFDTCYENLTLAQERVSRAPQCGIATPRPLGYVRREWFRYAAESAVSGTSISQLVFSSKTPAKAMAEYLPPTVECATRLARVLREETRASAIDPAWKRLPAEFSSDDAVKEALQGLLEAPDSDWTHHGDFTIENLFAGTQFGVIDWEHLSRGGPALYDVFSLLVSFLPAVPIRPEQLGDNPWVGQFREAFFGKSQWSRLYGDCVKDAAANLGIPAEGIWDQFLQFLLYRGHMMSERSGNYGRFHAGFLRHAARSKAAFVCVR
jgi:2-polyprenyl-3-methyl-5-hydroxy-6-metoxy-1,4-benzoquinol methylase